MQASPYKGAPRVKKAVQTLSDALRLAAQARWFFYLLIWLMILLVAGTISEKYIGLYLAQKTYFSSFIIWIGGIIPVPGGYTTLGLIFCNLLAKLIVERWTKAKIGTLITHCGALLLLLGGFLTAAYSYEGNMVIEEGGASNFISDYRSTELAVTDGRGKEIVFPESELKEGAVLRDAALPFTITIEHVFENIDLQPRKALLEDDHVHGMLKAVDLREAPPSMEDKNMPGVIFSIAGGNKKTDGSYGVFTDMPLEQHITAGGTSYTISLRHGRIILPFELKLIKFEKQLYPGTDKARGYSSEVILKDGALEWRSVISMNNPLRYKGYTFYQSSFIDRDGSEATVLAAVKNAGAMFPYISSIILCIGLLAHLFIRLPKLKTKRARESA